MLLEPFDRIARRAGYTCALCAGGPDRAVNVPALYFTWLDERDKIPICARHAEGLRTASGATKFFLDDKELRNVKDLEQSGAARRVFDQYWSDVASEESSFTCPRCGWITHDASEIRRRYCVRCVFGSV